MVILLLLVASAVLGSRDAFGQIVWTKDAHNPVLSGGASGAWNQHVFNPCVLYNSDSARYEMWFGACPDISAGPYYIGFASSKDRVTWSMHPTPVLSPDPGTWDEGWVADQRVLRENGQYKIWYTSWPSGVSKIGYATSADGITWLKDTVHNPVMGPGTSAWDAGGPDHPFVMPVPAGYKMWYTGWSDLGVGRIGYATSADGITWLKDTVHNPVLSTGAAGQWDDLLIGQPVVVRIYSKYYMWYSALHSGDTTMSGLAVSLDGINGWTKEPTNPLLMPSPGSWDAGRTSIYSVLLREAGDTLDLWSDGIASGRSYSIGHATSAVVVGVTDRLQEFPQHLMLAQNYPNPFNPTTEIAYQISGVSDVKLAVYDILGREVAVLVNENKAPGMYTVQFNGSGLASGVYLYRLTAGSFVETRKMAFVK